MKKSIDNIKEKTEKVADRTKISFTKTVKDSKPVFTPIGTIGGTEEFDKEVTFEEEVWKARDIAENVDLLIKPIFEDIAKFSEKTLSEIIRLDAEINGMRIRQNEIQDEFNRNIQELRNINESLNSRISNLNQEVTNLQEQINSQNNEETSD